MLRRKECNAAMASDVRLYSWGIGTPNIRLRFLRFVFRFLVFLALRFLAM